MTTKVQHRMIEEGVQKYGETFGGQILSVDDIVNPYVLYENRIVGDANFGNFVLIDAADYPTPIRYGDTNGGSPMNGLLGRTERTGGEQRTVIGYRAGENTQGHDNVFLGIQAGENSDSTGATFDNGNAIGIGRLALHDSVANATVAIGAEAANHIRGNRGVYIGSFAGNSTTSEESLGVGWRAGEQMTGNAKTAVGKQSGYQSTGNNLSALGYHAGLGADGDFLVAVGDFALGNATSAADFNVAVGSRALENCNNIDNTAVGYQAGYRGDANTIDSANMTLVGYRAGYGVDVGSGNTAIGRQACEGVTGTFNVGVGYLANRNHSHSNTSCLGQGSAVTGPNQVQLGNSTTTTYAYGAVQDRSDARDKTDIKDLTQAHIDFFMDVEWKQYRMDYRSAYIDIDEEGNEVSVEKDGSRSGVRYHIGAVAQQVEEAMKKHGIDFAGLQHHAVNGGEDVYTIGYQEFIGIQGEIIQRQHKDIQSIKEHLGL